jgi:hypothetical protein
LIGIIGHEIRDEIGACRDGSLTFGFIFPLAIQTHAAIPAAAARSGFMLAQAMVPPTGMMDAEHPMD